jgi:hypothetical protein
LIELYRANASGAGAVQLALQLIFIETTWTTTKRYGACPKCTPPLQMKTARHYTKDSSANINKTGSRQLS